MLGIISISLPTVVERIGVGVALGFRDFQISLPSWGTLTDAELDVFFAETCGRFPRCRFLHYNLPRAGRLLGGAEYARLAARHPNLVAIKHGGSLAVLREVLAAAPELQAFTTEFNFCALRTDAVECGFLISLAAVNAPRAKAYFGCRDGAELKRMAEDLQVGTVGRHRGPNDKHTPTRALRPEPRRTAHSGVPCDTCARGGPRHMRPGGCDGAFWRRERRRMDRYRRLFCGGCTTDAMVQAVDTALEDAVKAHCEAPGQVTARRSRPRHSICPPPQ